MALLRMKNNTTDIDATKYYIFYDGECGFCNFWVQWILKRDTKDQFLFSSLQSSFGQDFLSKRSLENKEINTIYLWLPNYFYQIKSRAIFNICEILSGKYKIISWLKFLPVFFTDKIYDLISQNRKNLFKNDCPIPDKDYSNKFI